jgi:hypothetical protein
LNGPRPPPRIFSYPTFERGVSSSSRRRPRARVSACEDRPQVGAIRLCYGSPRCRTRPRRRTVQGGSGVAARLGPRGRIQSCFRPLARGARGNHEPKGARTPPIEFGTGSWTSSVLHGGRPLIATNVPPDIIIVLVSKIAGLAPIKSGQCDASVFFHSRLFREGSCKGPSWNPLAEHRSGPVAGTTQDTAASRTKWL